MEKEFANYNQALRLKELGFDERCLKCYFKQSGVLLDGHGNMYNTPAPLYQQAFRWFREKYDYYISVFRTHDGNWGTDLWLLGVHKPKATVFGETYEEAELACLDKLIEIVGSKSE